MTSTRSSRARHLPRVRAAQPVVGLLVLPAVLDRLPEDAVLVAQAVAHRRELQASPSSRGSRPRAARGRRCRARRRAPARAGRASRAVSAPTTCCDDRVEQQVRDVVRERAADQELHRQVVDALGVLALVGLLGADPALREDVAHRARDRLEPLARPGGRDVDGRCRRAGGARRARRRCPRTGSGRSRTAQGGPPSPAWRVEPDSPDGARLRGAPWTARLFPSPSRFPVYVNLSTTRPSIFPAFSSESTLLMSSRRAS